MHTGKRKKRILISVGLILILLLAVRIALPFIILRVVNKQLTLIKDYKGSVKDIDLFLIAGCYKIQDIELNKIGGKIPVPFFSAEGIDIALEWRALFHGAIVGEIEVNKPVLNFVNGPTKATTQTEIDNDWTKVIDNLMPLRINKLEIKEGEIHYRDFHSDPKVDIFMQNVQVLAKNLSNANDNKELLPSTAVASAQVYGGDVNLNMKLNPLNLTPTFDMNAELKTIELTRLNDFLKAYGKFDVQKGTLSIYAEAAAKDSAIAGYVKPLIKDLDVVQWGKEEGTFFQKAWESIVETAGWIFKNKPEDQLATKVEFQGSLKGPNVNIFNAIGQIFYNAFIQALYPSLDNSINIAKVASDKADKTTLEKQYDKIAETEKGNDNSKKKNKKR